MSVRGGCAENSLPRVQLCSVDHPNVSVVTVVATQHTPLKGFVNTCLYWQQDEPIDERKILCPYLVAQDLAEAVSALLNLIQRLDVIKRWYGP